MVLSSLFCLFCLFPGHGTGRRRVAGDQSEKIRLTFFGLRDLLSLYHYYYYYKTLLYSVFIEEKHAKKKGKYLKKFNHAHI